MVKKMFDDGRQELLLLPQARTHAQYWTGYGSGGGTEELAGIYSGDI
jgi:hypothetical protein